MYDANLTGVPLSTSTATVTGTANDSKVGVRRRPLQVKVTVISMAGTAPILTPKVQVSNDNTAWVDHSIPSNVSLSNTTGELYMNVETDFRYWRVLGTIAGTAPSIVWRADVGIARP